jgi:hypothetical protein
MASATQSAVDVRAQRCPEDDRSSLRTERIREWHGFGRRWPAARQSGEDHRLYRQTACPYRAGRRGSRGDIGEDLFQRVGASSTVARFLP